jgi:glycosyltransferase involved in cell wall biosynthesis
MKKVLIVYKFLPQYRVDFYHLLRKKLFENDIELNLIYGKNNAIDALKKDEVDIEWAQYIPNCKIKIAGTDLLWQPCLAYLNDKDLIITQQENKLLINYYLMFSRHFKKYKYAFWGHVNNMQDDPNSRGNKFRQAFLKKSDWWFVYTKSGKKFLTGKNYPENRITVLNNAIDTISLKKYYQEITDAEVNELKSELGITGHNVGIFCGGMYPDKDFEFSLEACYRIKKELPDFHMLFVGSGVEAAKIIEAGKINSWIHYIGPKFGKDRVIYFKISSLQLMPRLVGLCILDSFALETPIITTEHPFHGPEIDYLENGINGIMTKDDITEYSKAVVATLQTGKYLEFIETGKLSAEKYTVENMAENFKSGILACLYNKQ